MYLSAHVPFAIVLGYQTGNPWLAFGAGIASHFLLDAIPHDRHSDLEGEIITNPARRKIFIVEFLVDAVVWISFVTWLWFFIHPVQPLVFWLAIAGGILPDAVTGLTIFVPMTKKIAPLRWIERANLFFHWHPLGKHVNPPRWFSLPIQLMTCLFLAVAAILVTAPF